MVALEVPPPDHEEGNPPQLAPTSTKQKPRAKARVFLLGHSQGNGQSSHRAESRKMLGMPAFVMNPHPFTQRIADLLEHGEVECDLIVFATGFDAGRGGLIDMNITGRDGLSLSQL